jgi:hypothetical protein
VPENARFLANRSKRIAKIWNDIKKIRIVFGLKPGQWRILTRIGRFGVNSKRLESPPVTRIAQAELSTTIDAIAVRGGSKRRKWTGLPARQVGCSVHRPKGSLEPARIFAWATFIRKAEKAAQMRERWERAALERNSVVVVIVILRVVDCLDWQSLLSEIWHTRAQMSRLHVAMQSCTLCIA